MPDLNDPCLACRIARGELRPPGGVIARRDGLLVHGLADPSPLPGWVVITSERHVRGLYDLDESDLVGLGPFMAEVMRAQRAVLGAEHVYAIALGDMLLHFHLHLIPKYPTTPERLRGRSAFDSKPEDARPAQEIEDAAAGLRRALDLPF